MKTKNLFVVGVAGLIAAAAGLYIALKEKNRRSGNVPPKAAPQINIDNSGDQSEFPKAPQGEVDLG
jgi:hypothetical protein